MNLNKYLEYLKKCNKLLGELSIRIDCNKIFIWLDHLYCAIRHGCLIRQYVYGDFYRLSRIDRKASLTYRRILKLFEKCNQPGSIHILENKKDFNVNFKDFVKRRWLYTPDMTYDEFCDFADKNMEAIVKPLLLSEGEGVHKIKVPQKDSDRKSKFFELKQNESLVEEVIKQHKDMSFNVKSVNTIRMHTLLTKDGDVLCFKPVLRVGVGNAVIDNYCAGGSVYEVDVDDGVVIGVSLSKDHKKNKVHPGTSIMMLGYQVPNWDKVIDGVKEAAKLLPQCRFIGWDVSITDNGIELIEGNHNTDYEFLEFQGTRGWYRRLKHLV